MTTVPLSPRHKLGIPAGESKLRWWRVLGDGDIPLVVNDRGEIVFFFRPFQTPNLFQENSAKLFSLR